MTEVVHLCSLPIIAGDISTASILSRHGTDTLGQLKNRHDKVIPGTNLRMIVWMSKASRHICYRKVLRDQTEFS